MLPSEARVAVRLAIKSTSADIVSAIQSDRAGFIRVRRCLLLHRGFHAMIPRQRAIQGCSSCVVCS